MSKIRRMYAVIQHAQRLVDLVRNGDVDEMRPEIGDALTELLFAVNRYEYHTPDGGGAGLNPYSDLPHEPRSTRPDLILDVVHFPNDDAPHMYPVPRGWDVVYA